MAERKVVNVKGNVATFQIEVKDRDNKVTAEFDACKDYGAFKPFVNGLSDKSSPDGGDSPLESVYNLYLYAADLKARAAARESVAVESTIIMVDKVPKDLMKYPIEKAVAAVNAMLALAAATGKEPQGAFVATRRKLLEADMAHDQGGQLVVGPRK